MGQEFGGWRTRGNSQTRCRARHPLGQVLKATLSPGVNSDSAILGQCRGESGKALAHCMRVRGGAERSEHCCRSLGLALPQTLCTDGNLGRPGLASGLLLCVSAPHCAARVPLGTHRQQDTVVQAAAGPRGARAPTGVPQPAPDPMALSGEPQETPPTPHTVVQSWAGGCEAGLPAAAGKLWRAEAGGRSAGRPRQGPARPSARGTTVLSLQQGARASPSGGAGPGWGVGPGANRKEAGQEQEGKEEQKEKH